MAKTTKIQSQSLSMRLIPFHYSTFQNDPIPEPLGAVDPIPEFDCPNREDDDDPKPELLGFADPIPELDFLNGENDEEPLDTALDFPNDSMPEPFVAADPMPFDLPYDSMSEPLGADDPFPEFDCPNGEYDFDPKPFDFQRPHS